MACLLTQGFTTDCLDGIGGAKEILLANWSYFEDGIELGGTYGQIDVLPTATIYRYVPVKNSLVFGEVPTPSQENGTLFYAMSAVFRIAGLTPQKRQEFNLLAQAKVIAFIRLYTRSPVLDRCLYRLH